MQLWYASVDFDWSATNICGYALGCEWIASEAILLNGGEWAVPRQIGGPLPSEVKWGKW